MSKEGQIKKIEQDWAENPRWIGVTRDYTAADVVRLRGSVQIEHTLARRGAEKPVSYTHLTLPTNREV